MALTKNPDPAPILVEGSIEEVFRRLEIWIGHASKGLSRVEFFSEFARQRVVQFLRNSLEKNSIPFHEIHLPCEETPSRFAWNFLDRLKEIPYGVVSVTGFPNPLLAVHPVDDYLRALNFNRENIAHNAIRQIWWISTPLLDRLVHVAPDLDSWFVLRMQLTESVQPSYELQSLMQPLDRPYVSLEEARKRADYLKERFTNAIRNNAPAGDILTQLALPAVQALHDAGADKEAKELGSWMLEQLSEEELQKEDDPNVYMNLISLANIYRSQGDYKKAEILIQRTLVIAEKTWGKQHPNYATCLNNLASLYISQGKYERIENILKRAIAIDENALGPEHPNLSFELKNLALFYYSQGKLELAERLLLRSIRIDENAFGSENPNLSRNLNDLALLYESQGKFSEAESMLIRAIKIDEKTLGQEHPFFARDLHNLAGLYSSQNKYEKAETLFTRALSINEKVLGAEHPDLVCSLNNLAFLYASQGLFTKAKILFLRAIYISKQKLGLYHPDLAVSLFNLAGLYISLRNYRKAKALLVRVIEILEKTSLNFHLKLSLVYNTYANLLREMDRNDKALEYEAKAAAIQKQREEMQSESGLTG